MNSEFYEGLDWNKVLNKEYALNYTPVCKSTPPIPQYINISEVYEAFNERDTSKVVEKLFGAEEENLNLAKSDQKYFEGCNYISPQAFIEELNHLVIHDNINEMANHHGVQIVKP